MMILMRKACCQNSNTDGCGQGVILGVLRKLERDGIELGWSRDVCFWLFIRVDPGPSVGFGGSLA